MRSLVENRKEHTIVIYLFMLGLLLLTYDRLPFFAYSNYAPSSIIAFVPAALLLLLKGATVDKDDVLLLVFAFLSIAHSLISAMIFDDFFAFIKHSIALITGLSVFFVSKYAFTLKEIKQKYIKIMLYSYTLPLLMGLMQIFNQFGLGIGYITEITSLFVTRNYVNRIQLLSGEPSWAAVHLMFLLVFLLFLNVNVEYKGLFIVISLVLLFLTFSAYTYMTLFFSYLIFILVSGGIREKFKMIAAVFFTLVVVFGVTHGIINMFNIDDYYVNRFNLTHIMNNNLLRTDGSIFVRVVFPIIGILEFIDWPIGYGGGFYYVKATDYLMENYSYGLEHEEVQRYAYTNTMTPMSLYSRLLAEEGLVAVLFFVFLYNLLKKCKSNREKYIWSIMVSLLLNFASYAFVDFWILAAALSSKFFCEAEVSTKTGGVNKN